MFNDTRRIALEKAIEFHRGADSDDPQTVLETAKQFETYLEAGDWPPVRQYQGRHAAPQSAGA